MGKAKKPRSAERRWGKLVGLALVLLLVTGFGWIGARSAAQKPEEPGPMLILEPIQVNLEDYKYLRLGLALETTDDAEVDGSRALDAAINLFSGRSIVELSQSTKRTRLKQVLSRQLRMQYAGKVVGVYFTDFVMQ